MSQLLGESITVRPCTLDDPQRITDLLNACAVERYTFRMTIELDAPPFQSWL